MKRLGREVLADRIIRQIVKHTDPTTVVENTQHYNICAADPIFGKHLKGLAGLAPALEALEDGIPEITATYLSNHIIANQDMKLEPDIPMFGVMMAEALLGESEQYEDGVILFKERGLNLAKGDRRRARRLERMATIIQPKVRVRFGEFVKKYSIAAAESDEDDGFGGDIPKPPVFG